MNYDVFKRLTRKGKRRAVIVEIISCVLIAMILYALGYAACAFAAGLEVLAGVY